MLLARRLCERGAGFVTVTTNFVWDMHADKNNATMTEGMEYVGAPFDHAVSAFINDVLLPNNAVHQVHSTIVLNTIKRNGGLPLGG